MSKQSYAETPEQESVNEAVDDTLKRKDLQQIGNIMLAHVHHYWNKHCGGKVSSPKLTAFYSACHLFYVSKLPALFHCANAGQKLCLARLFASI